MSSDALPELAAKFEREGARISKGVISALGVSRKDAESAAHCFTIAAALRTLTTNREQSND